MKKSLESDLPDEEIQARKFFEFETKRKRSHETFLDPSIFNDGSVPMNQVVTKFQINPKNLITPHDVERNFRLEQVFKELQFDEHDHVESSPEIPIHKTQMRFSNNA